MALLEDIPRALAGIVFDPCLDSRQEELRNETREKHVEAVLDPRSVEMATEIGFTRSGVADLPWASGEPDTPQSLVGADGDEYARKIADYAIERRFSAVLAPTHYLPESDDAWLSVDENLTRRLRVHLDRDGGEDVLIYYPLVLHAKRFRNELERERLIRILGNLPIDGIWLRVHPFGASSGRMALRKYIEACRHLHRLSLPLVAERTGTIGVALMAFGAVGGIESGLTMGERFDVAGLLRAPSSQGTPFLPPPRIYLESIGAFITRKQAEEFFENRAMKASFGCRDTNCCRRGTADTLADPRRHFLRKRLAEVGQLSRAPESLRPQLYLDDFLRPATDRALRASRVVPSLVSTQRRLEGWRETLGDMAHSGVMTVAVVPEGKSRHQQQRRPA